ncbi:hypothetical protein, partial [uncultured Roseivirga sp.]|uniref:hypothetical protein n=2 Tax=uncultured Roseivirga sp. TaxID=543088 RepID=UPI0030D93891
VEDNAMNKQIIRNAQDEIFYEANLDQENGWIYINWIGDIELEDVKRGTQAYLDLLAISGCRKLLNDNSLLTSNFLEINEWIEANVVPVAVQSGLRYMAHILSPKFIARFSAIDLGLRMKPVEFHAFKEIGKAEKWLKSKE